MSNLEYIKFLDLKAINDSFEPALKNAVGRVLDSGTYLFGKEVNQFEKEYQTYIGSKYCITTGNGLDALSLIIKAYKMLGHFADGDEIIVPANTFIASLLAIANNGLKPVLAEPAIPTFNVTLSEIQKKHSPKTKAIMLVHLYGRNTYQEDIGQWASSHQIKIIEDNAQAAGCRYQGKKTGSLGDAAGHSFYPGKNLAALGDAGAVTTDDQDLSKLIRSLANYGSSKKHHYPYQGINSRMDEFQAAVLREKLKRLDQDNQKRRDLAAIYHKVITHAKITLPAKTDEGAELCHVWHLFTILHPNRDDLAKGLEGKGIQTQTHYPIPPHKQPAFSNLFQLSLPITEKIHKETLSLPLHPLLLPEQIKYISDQVNRLA